MQAEWQEAERAARAALATSADTVALAAATFEPIAGSLSNFAWHVSVPGQDRFVRYARAGNERLGADLHAEGEILRPLPVRGLRREWCVAIHRRGCWSRSGLRVRRSTRLRRAVMERSGEWLRRCASCTS